LRTEVAALGLGDVGILFLPGECFLEIDAGISALAEVLETKVTAA
jgi:hypothetical protein